MFWIALAAQLSAPVLTNLDHWFDADDVPQYLLAKSNGVWLVSIRMTVNANGAIQRCEIEKGSGISDLDNFTCHLASRRGRFQPARSGDGSAVFGVYRTFVTWAVSDAPWDVSQISRPDLDLHMPNLPSGVRSPTLVHTMFAVDAKGQMSGCTVEPKPKPKRDENDPALVPIACDQLMKSFRPVPATDGNGLPVPSVQDALVRFSTNKP